MEKKSETARVIQLPDCLSAEVKEAIQSLDQKNLLALTYALIAGIAPDEIGKFGIRDPNGETDFEISARAAPGSLLDPAVQKWIEDARERTGAECDFISADEVFSRLEQEPQQSIGENKKFPLHDDVY